MSGNMQEVTNVVRELIKARSKRIERINKNWSEDANQTTFATNEAEEGLLDAYFAEQVTRQFGIPDGTYTYTFGGTNDTSTETGKRSTAEIILNRISSQLNQNGQHTAIELIIAALVNDSYSGANGDTVTFEIFKTEEKISYQKISSGTLGGEAYIVVKGFALKDKEATIEIFEKEPFLLMESETPLTVIQYDSLDAEEPNESVNKTQLKATFNNGGEAIVKIKFRPKVEDPDDVFNEWKEKFKPIVETSTNETGAVETSVRPQPRPDDLDTSVARTAHKPPKTTNLLWLKVKVSGDKQEYEEEFLNESDRAYFVLQKQTSWAHSQFGNLIAQFESGDNYNICNRTYPPPLRVVRNVNVVGTPISEIQRQQSRAVRTLFAVGRYQVIPITMNAAVAALNLDVSKNFDEETQDRVFDEFLIDIKRPPIIAYLEGNGDLGEAMYSAAQEWASIGVERGRPISRGRIAEGGESYYAGDGLNRAHITPEEIREALINSKNGQ
ncbi:hypothetical protein [uncultured Aquimarina sp.]|uniref:hypothetical protein n=1 Tax=uncultured Aquimarina sp. TaxID=575652 RepID=UPI002618FE26|nr:hypothetical protein [uncultured Aquimarina sp.]